MSDETTFEWRERNKPVNEQEADVDIANRKQGYDEEIKFFENMNK
jgi:hypothetical protein